MWGWIERIGLMAGLSYSLTQFSWENVFLDRVLQGLQPPGGQDHLAETDSDNNNGDKVMHR